MKHFVLVLIFVVCAVELGSAQENASKEIAGQLQCYLEKLKDFLPANAWPINENLINDVRGIQESANSLNPRKVFEYLQKTVLDMQQFMPLLDNRKIRDFASQSLSLLKAAASKFQAGTGNFNDVFTVNKIIRSNFNNELGNVCGESPDTELTLDEIVEKIKEYLGKLKAVVPPAARANLPKLIDDTDAVQKALISFDAKSVTQALKQTSADLQEFMSNIRNRNVKEHQAEILTRTKNLIDKFESGNSTYDDVFNIYSYLENVLSKYVPK